jgi:putative phage-type endonuclease
VFTEELQRTEAWVQARRGRLTASQFGAALGLSPYLSRVALWKQLVGLTEPFTGNPATDWGTAHEADAIHAFEVETGLLVEPAAFLPYEEWSGCSPDGWILDGKRRGILEAKAPYSQRLYEDIPEYYRAQVLGQLGITKADYASFICWTPDGHRIWRVDPQPKTWDRMQVALREFWQCVQQRVEPKRVKQRFNLQEQ